MSTKTKDDYLPIEIINATVTPAAASAIERAGQTVEELLDLHRQGDWGNLTDEDGEVYDRALMNGSTVESEFITNRFDRVWFYTAIGEYTQVYLPDER